MSTSLERVPNASLQSECVSNAAFYAFRLEPGTDLMEFLQEIALTKELNAGFIVTAVGSLTKCTIRYANKPIGTEVTGHFEIVSLVGIVAKTGCHVHISLSDGSGTMLGGHLLRGSSVYTTCEIVIGNMLNTTFTREPCCKSGYDELVVQPNNSR